MIYLILSNEFNQTKAMRNQDDEFEFKDEDRNLKSIKQLIFGETHWIESIKIKEFGLRNEQGTADFVDKTRFRFSRFLPMDHTLGF